MAESSAKPIVALKTASAILNDSSPIVGSTNGKMTRPTANTMPATAATHINFVTSEWSAMSTTPCYWQATIAHPGGGSHGQIVMLAGRRLDSLAPQHGQ